MEHWHEVRLCGRQASAQDVTEEVVVAVPLAPVVERDDEQVGPLQPFEHLLSPTGPRYLVAELCGQAIED